MLTKLFRPLWRVPVVLSLAAVWVVSAVHASNATSHQQPDGPVKLVLALGPAGRTLQDGSTSWDDVATAAINEWNQNLGLVQFAPTVADATTAQAGDGKNTVAFSDTIYGDDFGDETIAVTLLHYGQQATINETDVLVNRQDGFDSYRGPLQSKGTGQNLDLRRVLLHEFGHVLGLDHPDKVGQKVVAVMNSVISDTDGLTADDVDGTTSIYGDPALRSVPVTAFGVAVDDGRGKIYVSTQKKNGKGSLQVVDPYAARIVGSVRTGAKPNALALSDGGEHLYLGVDGLGVIDQLDPDTLAKTQEFTLGAQPGVTAADLAVLPGAPESVVVSQVGNSQAAVLHAAPFNSGDFAVYDQGVLRPQEAFDSHVSAGSPLILDESGQTFYGFYGSFYGATSGQISRFTIDAAGVSPTVQDGYLATGNLTGGAEYSQGKLYGTDGSVADLVHAADGAPFADVQTASRAYTVEADGSVGRTYFAVPRDGTAYRDYWPTILVEDNAKRSRVGNIALPRYAPLYVVRRWGTNGLLVCLSDKRMLLIRSELVGPGPVTGTPVIVTLGTPTRASIEEGGTTKSKVSVTRDGDLTAALDVHYSVTGTAQSGADFRTLRGVVTIPAGQATAKLKVVPMGSQFEGDPRTVQIRLLPDTNYRWGTSSAATVTLTNN